MTHSQSINIAINNDDLDDFCNKLLKRSRDIAKTHDALITLESFISVFAQPVHGTKEYQTIESTIKSITESSRQQLLEKYTDKLINALQHCNIEALAAVHTPLSRNGFYEILKTAIAELSDDDISVVMIWSANWLQVAKQLAEKASGYPDALDFKKSGIRVEEYQAMCDIDRVLN